LLCTKSISELAFSAANTTQTAWEEAVEVGCFLSYAMAIHGLEESAKEVYCNDVSSNF
jgi:pantothenate kinase type III